MESQTTLLNPNTGALRLDFNRDSMKDAVLTVNYQPSYIITTPDKSGYRTEIRDARTQNLVATIQRRELLWDLVTFAGHNGGKAIKMKKWMRVTTHPDGFPVTTLHTGAGIYVWKIDVVHRLILYSEDDLKTPIAYMIPGPRPSLVMERGTESFRDQIIASFLLLEQDLRMSEKRASTADGIIAIDRTVAGHYVRT